MHIFADSKMCMSMYSNLCHSAAELQTSTFLPGGLDAQTFVYSTTPLVTMFSDSITKARFLTDY